MHSTLWNIDQDPGEEWWKSYWVVLTAVSGIGPSNQKGLGGWIDPTERRIALRSAVDTDPGDQNPRASASSSCWVARIREHIQGDATSTNIHVTDIKERWQCCLVVLTTAIEISPHNWKTWVRSRCWSLRSISENFSFLKLLSGWNKSASKGPSFPISVSPRKDCASEGVMCVEFWVACWRTAVVVLSNSSQWIAHLFSMQSSRT